LKSLEKLAQGKKSKRDTSSPERQEVVFREAVFFTMSLLRGTLDSARLWGVSVRFYAITVPKQVLFRDID
jgi:hypothetical protein